MNRVSDDREVIIRLRRRDISRDLNQLLAAAEITREEIDLQPVRGLHVADLGTAPLQLVQDGGFQCVSHVGAPVRVGGPGDAQ
jgi:hypothetical protein